MLLPWLARLLVTGTCAGQLDVVNTRQLGGGLAHGALLQGSAGWRGLSPFDKSGQVVNTV
jgi:hypothetical protein